MKSKFSCQCLDSLCTECLLIKCRGDECKTHTIEMKLMIKREAITKWDATREKIKALKKQGHSKEEIWKILNKKEVEKKLLIDVKRMAADITRLSQK